MSTRQDDVANRPSAAGAEDPQGTVVRKIEYGVDWLAQSTAVLSRFYRRRAEIPQRQYDQARLDRILVVWWAILVVCYTVAYLQVPWVWPVAIALSVLRIMNITFWNLRIALVQTGKSRTGEALHLVTSIKRSLILGMVGFLELIVAFACVYAAFPNYVHLPDNEQATAGVYLYFSSITQLTIGYGDVAPQSWLRLISVIQGLSGLALLAVTIGRFLALLRVEEVGR